MSWERNTQPPLDRFNRLSISTNAAWTCNCTAQLINLTKIRKMPAFAAAANQVSSRHEIIDPQANRNSGCRIGAFNAYNRSHSGKNFMKSYLKITVAVVIALIIDRQFVQRYI